MEVLLVLLGSHASFPLTWRRPGCRIRDKVSRSTRACKCLYLVGYCVSTLYIYTAKHCFPNLLVSCWIPVCTVHSCSCLNPTMTHTEQPDGCVDLATVQIGLWLFEAIHLNCLSWVIWRVDNSLLHLPFLMPYFPDCWCEMQLTSNYFWKILSLLQRIKSSLKHFNELLNNISFTFLLCRMDCLVKTVRTEGYFGMYRGKIIRFWILRTSTVEYVGDGKIFLWWDGTLITTGFTLVRLWIKCYLSAWSA